MIKRLRIKFIFINMTIVTIMLIVILGLVLNFTRQNMENQSIQMMQAIASTPPQPVSPGEPIYDIYLPYFTLQVSRAGELVATGGEYYDLSDRDFLASLLMTAFMAPEQTGIISAYNLRYYRVVTPTHQYVIFMDISSTMNTMESLLKSCIFIGALSFMIFLLLSFFLARWAVTPVDEAWNQQRQFVADASHELKTPLTVIITNAELLQSPAYDEPSRAQFADNILTMSRQMRGLVEGLLDLARVDNDSTRMALSSLDLSQLIADAILPFEPLYFEKGLDLQCHVERNIRLNGSESHLRRVMDILLDNAAKYSSPQSAVTVSLKKQGTHCLLAVSNPGAAIPKDELKNIFKRFYRIDKARSMNHSYGLGLSIADSIISAHHGRIWAESVSGVNTFFVQLPIYLYP